jgi:exosortase/archaeosortase family protein
LIYAIDLSLLENFIAELIGSILGLHVIANNIFFNETIFLIQPNCTGLVSAGILFAVVFSLKKPEMKTKSMIFLIGGIFLLLINLVRIYFVVLMGVLFGLAELTHIISWFAMTAFILGAWFYLTKKIAKIKGFEGFL